MKAVFTACMMLAFVAAPAYPQDVTKPQSTETLNCPPMANADAMQKQMGAMMSDMQTMMDRSSDPATKARMRAMHDRMSAMMANMQTMHQGMMGGKSADAPATLPAPSGDQNPDAHHPKE